MEWLPSGAALLPYAVLIGCVLIAVAILITGVLTWKGLLRLANAIAAGMRTHSEAAEREAEARKRAELYATYGRSRKLEDAFFKTFRSPSTIRTSHPAKLAAVKVALGWAKVLFLMDSLGTNGDFELSLAEVVDRMAFWGKHAGVDLPTRGATQNSTSVWAYAAAQKMKMREILLMDTLI